MYLCPQGELFAGVKCTVINIDDPIPLIGIGSFCLMFFINLQDLND